MDRREFLKVTGAGALTLFLSGCGMNGTGNKKTS
ncbi:MAG: twin-arginine translocation signal domain-containing protein [Acidaminococcaceae bacterium]|nr:twin-arginine translocation signal domain-containing protein [Acidaminococcaceae bacterium]